MSQIKEERENADFKEGSINLCSAILLKALTKILKTDLAVSREQKKHLDFL